MAIRADSTECSFDSVTNYSLSSSTPITLLTFVVMRLNLTIRFILSLLLILILLILKGLFLIPLLLKSFPVLYLYVKPWSNFCLLWATIAHVIHVVHLAIIYVLSGNAFPVFVLSFCMCLKLLFISCLQDKTFLKSSDSKNGVFSLLPSSLLLYILYAQ